MRKSLHLICIKTAVFWQLFFSGNSTVFSQVMPQKIQVDYKMLLNQSPPVESNAKLWFSDGVSVYNWGDNNVDSQFESEPGSMILQLRDSNPQGTINRIDFADGTLTTLGSLFNEPYLLKEVLPELQWTLGVKTKEVEGLRLNEAKTTFRGRNYTVWYCPDLPFAAGPWKLHGLPGVILEAYDEEDFLKITFTAVRLGSKAGTPPKSKATPAQVLSIDDFRTRQENLATELIKRIQAKLPRGAQLTVQNSAAEFLERNF
jgi:GLPGLI family protein